MPSRWCAARRASACCWSATRPTPSRCASPTAGCCGSGRRWCRRCRCCSRTSTTARARGSTPTRSTRTARTAACSAGARRPRSTAGASTPPSRRCCSASRCTRRVGKLSHCQLSATCYRPIAMPARPTRSRERRVLDDLRLVVGRDVVREELGVVGVARRHLFVSSEIFRSAQLPQQQGAH